MRFRSSFLLLITSLVVGAACVRLGFWQLDRLSQRRARNATASDRLSRPPTELMAGTIGAVEPYQRVRLSGTLAFDREVALTARPRDGSPGVHIATPVAIPGTDTLVLASNSLWPLAASPASSR